jgi:hypothetical protein
MLLGLGAALPFNARRPKFNARGPWLRRLARFAAGTVGVLVFWLGLKLITPPEPFIVEAIFRYVRYGLVVFWALSLAPMLFVRLRLAEPD